MIKYKNLLLSVLCVAVGALITMTNFHKGGKNIEKNNNKLITNYMIQNRINNKIPSINIENTNFSLYDNKSNLSTIMLSSEENIYGFKNMYMVASTPHKIKKEKILIKNIKNKINENNIKFNNDSKNVKISWINNAEISYSNYNTTWNNSIVDPLNFTMLLSKDSDETKNNDKNNLSQSWFNKRFHSVAHVSWGSDGTIGVFHAAVGLAFLTYKYKKKILKRCHSINNEDGEEEVDAVIEKVTKIRKELNYLSMYHWYRF